MSSRSVFEIASVGAMYNSCFQVGSTNQVLLKTDQEWYGEVIGGFSLGANFFGTPSH